MNDEQLSDGRMFIVHRSSFRVRWLRKRLTEAMKGGKKLHRDFDKHVPIDLGLSIAWQDVPWQLGGWADD